ncbi:GNAT family N-acetyltransferase [Shinella sp. S4-D37]|uniref:GNAT family N-acetyltransferase n=1 Tax=Shinella sp. S4-D37 TaxID=3161999 RepID=UPI0034667B73
MKIQIALAENRDLKPWMMLATQVVPLFGPMPDFEAVLERKIRQEQAFCARTTNQGSVFIGGVLIGGTGNEHWIRWLAVLSEHRRLSVGRRLVETAIAAIPANSTIYVDTFAEGSPGAYAANRLYRDCGFEAAELWKTGTVIRQRYVLRRPAT